MEKIIIYDLLHNSGSWGDKSVFVPLMAMSKKEGYSIILLTGYWNNYIRDGYFDRKSKLYDGRPYLYDPSIEPIDYFKNLICPTLNVKEYYNEEEIDLNGKEIINFCFPGTEFLKNENFLQIDYQLSENLKNDEYHSIKNILSKTTNILLYATYDTEKIYEQIPDRLKGIDFPEERFEMMKETILSIDEWCVDNPKHRIILINKKAVEWDSLLKSNYFDLRHFEKLGLCFSQMFHLSISNCVATIGQTSSMMLWCSFQERRNHIIYTNIGNSYIQKFKYFSINKKITEDINNIFL